MLMLSKNFAERPVMSLRTGGRVGTAVQAIINPNNLKIEGFYCDDRVSRSRLILVAQDIREVAPQGFIINDREVLSSPDDLVRLKEVLNINFQLAGKRVVTNSKKKLGKVSDWAVDSKSLYIQKLYVTRSPLKALNNHSLSIDRTQIVEITDKEVIVRDVEQTEKSTAPMPAPA